jgi:hypothetical protein
VTVPQFEDAFERADAINATLEGVVVCQPTLYDFMGFVLRYKRGPSKCGHEYKLSLVSGGAYHSFDRCYAGKMANTKVIVDDRVPPDFVLPIVRDRLTHLDPLLNRFQDIFGRPRPQPDPNSYYNTNTTNAYDPNATISWDTSGKITNWDTSGKINDWRAYGDPPLTYQTLSEKRREWEAIQESERRMKELEERVREINRTVPKFETHVSKTSGGWGGLGSLLGKSKEK